jgi:hypothetical protein
MRVDASELRKPEVSRNVHHKGTFHALPPGLVPYLERLRSMADERIALQRNPLPDILLTVDAEPLLLGNSRVVWYRRRCRRRFIGRGDRDPDALMLGQRQRLDRAQDALFVNRFQMLDHSSSLPFADLRYNDRR